VRMGTKLPIGWQGRRNRAFSVFLILLAGAAGSWAAEGKKYDPTAQPGFKGPEVVSGPDEPQIPGGFRMERYAFCGMIGGIIDGARKSCMAWNYCESVWWTGDKQVFFGDNILNVILVLDGDRLYRFAGSGVRGDKDGPAECAEFSFGVYVDTHPGFAKKNENTFILGDPKNGKIKKIFKKPDGRWWVETIAGGGKRKLKTGEVEKNPLNVKFWGGGPTGVSLWGPKKDYIKFSTGRRDWRCTFVMYPDGRVKCLSEGRNKEIPTGLPPEKGFRYVWRGGNWASVCYKVSRKDNSAVKVIGYTDAEIKAKFPGRKGLPVDGPVNDCSFWTTGGPLRPDGRAIYTIGGDELNIRRIMNGRAMTLDTKTGKWFTSRRRRFNSIGCASISRLTWDGYAYLTYAYGRKGMFRARLYAPLKTPTGK